MTSQTSRPAAAAAPRRRPASGARRIARRHPPRPRSSGPARPVPIDAPAQHVAGAEAARFLRRQQDVAGADRHADRARRRRAASAALRARCRVRQAGSASCRPARARSTTWRRRCSRSRPGWRARRARMVEHVVRRAGRDHPPLFEHDHPFAERVDLAMAVRDVKHRNPVASRSSAAGRP